MNASHGDYIRLIKDRLSAARELDVTADDYIHAIYSIYGDVYTDNLRKFYHKMRKEIPELEINQLTKMITERGDLWETILEEQIEHLSDFAENLFKVPGCILFERNKEIHEKIQEYSVKEDYKLDNEIAEISKNIEKKRAYLNLLKVQAAKLEECKNAVFDKD